MTLQQLEYILALARYGNFAKAAEACHVTQPTLSTMVQKLEDEIEAKIFERSRQPIRPTAIGQKVLRQSQIVLEQARQIKDLVHEERQSLGGIFRLGILPTIAPYLLPRFLPTLMNEHPEMDIRVMEMKTEVIKDALRRGEIDAGIIAEVPDLDEFSKAELFYEPFYAYVCSKCKVAQRDTVRTADIGNEEVWLLDEGHCFRDQLLRFCQMQSAQKSQLTYSLGTLETFMRMVEGGRGMTVIPGLAVQQLDEQQSRLVRPFAIPVPTRVIEIVTAKGYIRRKLIDTLSEAVKSSVPTEMLSVKPTQKLV